MALSFDGSVNLTTATGVNSGIDANANYTACVWLKSSGARGGGDIIQRVHGAFSLPYDVIRTSHLTGNPLDLAVNNGGTTTVASSVTDLSDWTWVCMRRTSLTNLDWWIDEAQQTANTHDVTGRSSTAKRDHLGGGNDSNQGPFSYAHWKLWTTDLAEAELLHERLVGAPVSRLDELWRWCPLQGVHGPFGLNSSFQAMPGHNNSGDTLTSQGAGSITIAAGEPPVRFGRPRPLFLPSAAAPAPGISHWVCS